MGRLRAPQLQRAASKATRLVQDAQKGSRVEVTISLKTTTLLPPAAHPEGMKQEAVSFRFPTSPALGRSETRGLSASAPRPFHFTSTLLRWPKAGAPEAPQKLTKRSYRFTPALQLIAASGSGGNTHTRCRAAESHTPPPHHSNLAICVKKTLSFFWLFWKTQGPTHLSFQQWPLGQEI